MANGIKKTDWSSSFSLTGEAKVNDYTYKIDAHSEKSSWVYNSLNLGIDCGEKYGTVYAELMGGYSEDKANILYAHGKDENGNDDWSAQITVDWEDRFNDDILEEVGEGSFLTVGLEKTTQGKTYYKNFLSAYDAIAYIKEHLTDGTVVNVRGRLQYSEYNGNVQVRKTIQRITLSNVDDPSKYGAHFTQSILLDKDSASLKNIDKDKGVIYVDARVLDYVKEINGTEIKGQYPFRKTFEFEMDFTKPELCKKIVDKIFKVKKGVTQITFEGDFIEGGAVVSVSYDDLDDVYKEMVDMGLYTKEDVIDKCSGGGSRERRMVLRRPYIKLVGEDKTPVIQIFEQKYDEDDLAIEVAEEVPFEENEPASDDDSSMDWLNDL